MSGSFKIREAIPSDVPEIAALHVATFNETHGPGPTYAIRKEQWEKIFQEKDKDWFCLIVQDENGKPVGFAKGQRSDTDIPGYSGELNKIYILRKYQRSGLGRKLICRVAREFAKRAISSILLFGDANSRSNGFYERMGAERLYSKEGAFHGGYGWKDLQRLMDICIEDINEK